MPKSAPSAELRVLPAAPDLAAAVTAWLHHLAHERRLSARTIEAYGRDARQFLAFLEKRFGAPPGIADFTDCAPGDLRAFLAHRRAEGVEGRSLQRALSALKSLARHIARESGQTAAALGAVRAPKAGRRLPRPLSPTDAKAMTTTALREGEEREPWVLARDAAVLALCYGAGLRISEALSIRRGDAPVGETDAVTIVGKGQKSRSAPIIPPVRKAVEDYLSLCPFALKPAGPLFVGAKGGPLVAAHRATGDGADARRARPARKRDATRAPPFVRHPSSGSGRRLENHPGPARPRLAVDDAGLYGSRQRAPACGLSLRPSARLKPRLLLSTTSGAGFKKAAR